MLLFLAVENASIIFCIYQTKGLVWDELITGQKRIAFGKKPARKSANGEAMMSNVSRRKNQQMENQNRKARTTKKKEE
jgi:hypothetical protein